MRPRWLRMWVEDRDAGVDDRRPLWKRLAFFIGIRWRW